VIQKDVRFRPRVQIVLLTERLQHRGGLRPEQAIALFLKVGQESKDSRRIEISQIEPRDGNASLLVELSQQQNYAVAIAVDGVWTGAAKAGW
jgi:hypothetical protein